jgi:ABC-2 type transport system ATP-binding protein
MSIIEVSDLVKTYGDGTQAVKGISFDVEDGGFFGFLGPNGAGKSTTIKILTTILSKTAGKASVAGYDIDSQAKSIRKVIGVQNQETVLDDDLTGRENLMLQGQLQQVPTEQLKERVNELLKVVDLEDAADKRAGFYSGGMRKRLDLATTLVHNPRVLFLDEPTTGLDPQSRSSIWSYLKKLNDQGITIFMTTQYLDEVDRLCRRVAIIDHGEIVAQGTPTELKQDIGADAITLGLENNAVPNGSSNGGDVKDRAKKVLENFNVTKIMDANGTGLTVYAKNGTQLVPELVRAFDNAGIRLSSISVAQPTLDDVFLKHTGRHIRPEEVSSANRPSMFARRRRGGRQ